VPYRMKSLFLGMVLFEILSFSSIARAETLVQAVQAALAQNPTLEQVIATQKMAREDLKIEKSSYYPTVNVNTAIGRVYGDNATSRGLSVERGDGYSNLWEGSLAVNQMIFDSLKTPRMVDAAKARMNASDEALRDARESLVLQLSLSYLNIMRIRESLNILKSHVGILSDYEGKIEGMVKNGLADDSELQQARTLRIDLKNLIAEYEGQERTTGAEFFTLSGHLPEKEMIKPIRMDKHFPKLIEDALQFSLITHPQVKMVNKELEASKMMSKAQESALYPTLSGELSTYNKDVKDIIGGEVQDNRALIRLNWAMSAGGAEFARIKKAEEEGNRVEAKKKELLRRLETTIRMAYSDLDLANDKESLAVEGLTANQKLLNAYKAQFEGGKVRILQLLQGENEVLGAKLENLNAQYRTLAAQFTVLGSLAQIQNALAFQGAAGSE
jgi:adhesin transport system outer membrane protein